eukprot:SAG22_NODE_3409_length_1730_cov_1.484365_1_plen_241_part_10
MTSGSPYWYNVETQETTWEHPDEIRYRNQLWALRSRYHYHHHDQQLQPEGAGGGSEKPDDSFIARMEAQLSQHIDEAAASPLAFQLAPIPTMEEVEQARRAYGSPAHFTAQDRSSEPGLLPDHHSSGQLEGPAGQGAAGPGVDGRTQPLQPRQSALKAARSNRPRVTFGEDRVHLIPTRHENKAYEKRRKAMEFLAPATALADDGGRGSSMDRAGSAFVASPELDRQPSAVRIALNDEGSS